MSLDTYRVVCSRGHDRIELTGQAAVDHAQVCTGRKVGTVPSGWGEKGAYVAWRSPLEKVKARPWKAPAWKPFSLAAWAEYDDLSSCTPAVNRFGTASVEETAA